MILPNVSWTIAGFPVFLEDGWTATAIAQGGFDRFQGVITEESWHALEGLASQGSIVKGWTNGVEPLWEGRLATIPDFSEGKATVAAMGYYVKAIKKEDRLFIQSRDMSIWQPLDGEPFLNSSGVPVYAHYRKITCSVGNRIRWHIPASDAIAVNNGSGAGFYAEGVNLKRIVYTMAYATPDENNDTEIEVLRANGPNGAETSESTAVTNAANNGSTKDITLAGSGDLVLLTLHTNTAHTAAATQKFIVTKVRLNSDIETGDTFHAYEVLDYIGNAIAFDTSGVETSTYNVLPFDFEGNYAEAADYLAELEDKVWAVYDDAGDGPRMTYTSWGAKDWQVYLSHGAVEALAPLEVYNRAVVWYETPTGVARKVGVTASPDPLAAAGITNSYTFNLEDRQQNETFATSVATKLAARFSRQRYAGRLTVYDAWNEQGRDNPYGIRPGDTVTIADWAPGDSITLRVVEVEYRHDRVDLGLEQPINLVHVLDQMERRRRRRRRRRKRD